MVLYKYWVCVQFFDVNAKFRYRKCRSEFTYAISIEILCHFSIVKVILSSFYTIPFLLYFSIFSFRFLPQCNSNYCINESKPLSTFLMSKFCFVAWKVICDISREYIFVKQHQCWALLNVSLLKFWTHSQWLKVYFS